MSPDGTKRWKLKFSPRALKDVEKLNRAGLKEQAQKLLDVIRVNPWQSPPPYEKLTGDLSGKYSRRITIKHRLVYDIYEKKESGGQDMNDAGIIRILSMWTHYE